MATSLIKNSIERTRSIQIPYTIAALGQWNTSLKNAIDADMPSGYTFKAIAGYSTNNANVSIWAMFYSSSDYSLRLKNNSNSAIDSTNVRIDYICTPI